MSRVLTSFISKMFGLFASKEFPASIQKQINKSYVFLMKLDMDSFLPPENYPSLNALFTREFIKQRDISQDLLISPVDALVTDVGCVEKGKSFQIKDMSYDVDKLLGDNYDSSILEDGHYVNLYLSPRDYHRYHAPCCIAVKSITHIPGKLYPVNKMFLNLVQGLFEENERVILEAENNFGKKLFIVLVGALNVGKMHIVFDKTIQTNSSTKNHQYKKYENLSLNKGDLIGWFEMGSTVLLFGEKDAFELELDIYQKVKFGEKIGNIHN